jgi:hypothetical protein
MFAEFSSRMLWDAGFVWISVIVPFVAFDILTHVSPFKDTFLMMKWEVVSNMLIATAVVVMTHPSMM